jgi:hypothetical protein
MPHRPTQFQSTVVKPYYKDNSSKPLQNAPDNAPENALKDAPEENYNQYTLEGDHNLNIVVVNIPQP